MKYHFRQYWKLYLVLVAVVVWPMVIFRMQTIPPIDKESQVAILEWIDYEIEKEYGSAMWEEFRTLQENLEEDGYGLGDPRIDRIVENNLAGSEALWKDLDELENAYGDKLDAWNRIARKGLSYKKFTERWGESEKYESFEFESYDAPDFLFVQLSVKLQRSFADKNIARANWNKALDILEDSVHFSDSVKASGIIGHLISVATRSIAFE